MLNPGDFVIHPHHSRRLATVIRVLGSSAVLEDDLGRLTARTDAVVALTIDPRIHPGYAPMTLSTSRALLDDEHAPASPNRGLHR